MFKEGASSNRQNGRLLLMLLSTNFIAKWELVFVLTQENAYFIGFNLKPTEST